MEKVTVLIDAWKNLCETYPYLDPTFQVRHDFKIWTCNTSGIISSRLGTQICKYDINPDMPDEEEYQPSNIEPLDDVEKEIINAYNALVLRRLREEQEKSNILYQTETMSILYNTKNYTKPKQKQYDNSDDSDDSDTNIDFRFSLGKSLRKALRKRGIKADIEEDIRINYLYVNMMM
jgi:hypothetical protein